MKLSVILPVYNAEDTLEVALQGLARQNWDQPWEIIVADNRSTDASMSIVARFAEDLPNLRVVEAAERQGQPYAMNVGAAAALGESIAFCDGDDEVDEGWVRAIGEALEEHDFVASRMDARRLSSPLALKAKGNGRQQTGLIQYTYVPYLPFAGSGGLGIKRRLHEAIGGFDESMLYLLDTDYCWRVQLAGHPLVFVPEALYHVRHRDDARGLYRQGRNWGEYNVLLLKRYREHGMPAPTWDAGLKLWWRLILQSPALLRPGSREGWLWRFGYRVGQVRGSIKHRMFAP